MKPIDKIVRKITNITLKKSKSDANGKLYWSYWIVQALLWTIIFRMSGIKKKDKDGTKRYFTVEDLKEILLENNSAADSEKLEDERLRGLNTEVFNDSGKKSILDTLFQAKINDKTVLLNTDIQKDPYPGYVLVDRELYDIDALEADSKGIDFTKDHYSDMPDIFSSWILLNPPKALVNQAVGSDIVIKRLNEASLDEKAKTAGILKPTVTQFLYNIGIGDYSSDCDDLVRLADIMSGKLANKEEMSAEFKDLLTKYGWSGTSEEDNNDLEEFMAQYSDFVQYLIDEGKQDEKKEENAVINEYKGKLDDANVKLDDANSKLNAANLKLDAAISWFKEHNIPVPAEVLNPPKAN